MRKALGLPDNDKGVAVIAVTPEGPSDGQLQLNDILLAIDDNPIDSAGNINVDGETLVLHEIVERKFADDIVKLDFLRDGKRQTAEIKLKPLPGSPHLHHPLWPKTTLHLLRRPRDSAFDSELDVIQQLEWAHHSLPHHELPPQSALQRPPRGL